MSFALVATYQYYENYAFHDWDGEGECPARWKSKGNHEEVIRNNLNIDEVISLGDSGLYKLICESELGTFTSDNCTSYHLLDWELIKLDAELVNKVKTMLSESQDTDFGFVRYQYHGTMFAFDWAVDQLINSKQLELSGRKYHDETFKLVA